MNPKVEVTNWDCPDVVHELLVQVRDFLRTKIPDPPNGIQGPHWYQASLRDGLWVLEFKGKSPNDGHEATWIEADLKEMVLILIERKNGRRTSMDFSLYEEDCFERLANATRDAALGKFSSSY